jgi:hypothetical protein
MSGAGRAARTRGFEAASASSDSKGRKKLADRAAAGFTADRPVLAEPNEELKLLFAGFAAEFIKRHGMVIVDDFPSPGKRT